MSKTFPLLATSLGGVALVLGIAYGVTSRQHRDAEIDMLQRQVASIEARRAAEAEIVSREAALNERIAELETALATAQDEAERAASEATALAAAAAEAPASPAAEAPAEVAVSFGDPAAGEEVFMSCSGCHQVGQGAEDGIGPQLNGIFGRDAAGIDGFPYSQSLTRMGADGLVWTLETLDAYIENPLALVSGTRMSFDGLADPQERADLLAFLRIYSDNPANIPEAPATATATDHDLDPEILAIQGDPEYGEYLAGECVTCHQASGANEGIPSITLWPEEAFVVAMHAYKQQLRPHPVMQMIAGRLNNEEIAALAAYFAQLSE